MTLIVRLTPRGAHHAVASRDAAHTVCGRALGATRQSNFFTGPPSCGDCCRVLGRSSEDPQHGPEPDPPASGARPVTPECSRCGATPLTYVTSAWRAGRAAMRLRGWEMADDGSAATCPVCRAEDRRVA